MFCPKCKYTTFDHLNSCPRCGYKWNSVREELALEWLIELQEIEEDSIEISEDGVFSASQREEQREGEQLSSKFFSSPKERAPVIEEVEVPLEESLFTSNSMGEEVKGEDASIGKDSDVKENVTTEFFATTGEEVVKIEEEGRVEDSALAQEDGVGEISVDILLEGPEKESLEEIKEEKREEVSSAREEVWDIEFTDLEIEDLTIESSKRETKEGTPSHRENDKKETKRKDSDIEVLDIVFEEEK